MTHFARAALVAALAFGLGACTDPSRLGGGAGENTVDLNAANGAGFNDGAADPSSPAYFAQSVGDRVLFEVDQSSLNPTAQTTLSGQAQWMAANPSYAAIIEGHADEQGTREYNLALGARRANSVQEYLISQGVAGSRLRTITYGKERPLEVCSAEACYAKNRRAVTVLQIGAGS